MNIKKSMMIALFFAGGGGIVGYRLYQLLFFTDQENGFYNLENSSAQWILTAVIAIFLVAMGLLVGFDDKFPSKPVSRSYALGVFTVVFGAISAKTTFDNTDVFIANAQDKSVMDIIYFALLLAFTLFLFYYAICIFAKIHIHPVMALIPVVFAGFRLAYHFLNYFGLARSSEVVLQIIMLVFVALFWHFFGKYVSVVKFRKTRRFLLYIGLAAAFFCFLTTVPTIISQYSFSNTQVRVATNEIDFNIATGVYILVFLGASFFPNKYYKKDKNADNAENSEKTQEV